MARHKRGTLDQEVHTRGFVTQVLHEKFSTRKRNKTCFGHHRTKECACVLVLPRLLLFILHSPNFAHPLGKPSRTGQDVYEGCTKINRSSQITQSVIFQFLFSTHIVEVSCLDLTAMISVYALTMVGKLLHNRRKHRSTNLR